MGVFIVGGESSVEELLNHLPPGSHVADDWASIRIFPVRPLSTTASDRVWLPIVRRSDIDFALLVHQRSLRAKLVYDLAMKRYPYGSEANLNAREAIFGISSESLDEFSTTLGMFACDGGLVDGLFIDTKGPTLDDAVFNLAPDAIVQAVGVVRIGNA